MPTSPDDNTSSPPHDSLGSFPDPTAGHPSGHPADHAAGERLAALGWDQRWAATSAGMVPPAEVAVRPGRVARVDRGRVHVLTDSDDVHATLHGPHTPTGSAELVTGDWVLLHSPGTAGTGGTGSPSGAGSSVPGELAAVLPRRTAVTRGAGRRDTRAQVLAANVDVVLVVAALSSAPNQARLDRMITVAWESGAQPVVVLSKADLCRTAESERDQVADSTPGVPVHLVSVADGRGLADLSGELAPGRTVVLLGVSGVGKSSLVNALAGTELMAVGQVRADGKGRHTTTSRDLVVLPGLGVLIDTPGLRGVQLWDSGGDAADPPAGGLERTFADIEELAAQCRFTDCGHRGEPGCAVGEAIAEGRLTEARLASYVKLQREINWLRSRYDARVRAEERRKWRNIARAMRDRGHR